jgi:hypothetical protein
VRVIAIRRPVSPRLGDCPSFSRPRREQFTCVPHYFPTCEGVVSSAMQLMAVLVNPAPVEASWCVLCWYRSGFEGGAAVVGRPAVAVGRFEGVVNGGPYATHGDGRGNVFSLRTPTASGCHHSARRGAAVAGMAAQV